MGVTVEILEGNRRKVVASFRVPGVGADLDDVSTWTLTDPDEVTISRQRAGSSVAALEAFTFTGGDVTKDAVGVYSLVLEFPDDGTYTIGAEGTGAVVAYEEATVVVRNARARP